MIQDFALYCTRFIRWTFYVLFFIVPLSFTSNTYELFEFNKMWVVFGLTICIAALWITKMILLKQFRVQKTPLDIFILLFLLSQFISSIFSLDSHVSFWGYYSRFNGGFYSLFAYILLYYAFVSNMGENAVSFVKRSLWVSVASGAIVALWGLPSHFGYDPTCFVFRGTLDVSCWTDSFHPTVRIFSTLGQPNWLAAYLAILLPIIVAFFISGTLHAKKEGALNIFIPTFASKKLYLVDVLYVLIIGLLYVAIIYTVSRSGFLGLLAGAAVTALFGLFLLKKHIFGSLKFVVLTVVICFLATSAFLGTPVTPKLGDLLQTKTTTKAAPPPVAGPALETGGTESGTIRLIVWRGAIEAWKHNPIFGTGVETFAYAYYKYRPVEHNMTSEWDYLYNKAHNEYLNYLTTTGLFGLGTYLAMIAWFLLLSAKQLLKKEQSLAAKILVLGILAGYISILVSNFLGFSVVLPNLYLFLLPALVFILFDMIKPEQAYVFFTGHGQTTSQQPITTGQWISISGVSLYALFLLFTLLRFWQADVAFAYGYNVDHVGSYDLGEASLKEAVGTRDDEPVFKDEQSSNAAALAIYFAQQKNEQKATEKANEAILLSDDVTTNHPNNVVFWKTRVRVFYALSQVNPQYLPIAVEAIKKANELAPTDAKISYNFGVLTGQNGDSLKAVSILQQTIQLKPDYRDAYFALGLFYRDLAVDKNKKVIHPEYEQKAVETFQYSLTHINKNDTQIKETLTTWGE